VDTRTEKYEICGRGFVPVGAHANTDAAFDAITATSRAILTVFLVIGFLSRRMGAPLEPKPIPPNREIQSTLEAKRLSWLLTVVDRLGTEASQRTEVSICRSGFTPGG
jgi:hypothetical protein